MRPKTRELAQRLNGSDEILLLWHSESDTVEILIRDIATGASFQLEVAASCAIDAFYHPYAYAASHRRFDRVRRTATTIDDDER